MFKRFSFYCVLVCIASIFSILSYRHVIYLKNSFKITPNTKPLSLIPENDRMILGEFFRLIIISECFAYTLFGDKPISMSYCYRTNTPRDKQTTAHPHFYEEQWTTWEKYKHLFPSKNFILRTISSPKTNEIWIILINKKHFCNTVQKHQKLFRSVLSQKITPEQLLNAFSTQPDPFQNALKNRAILIGILFGYGKNNSSLFLRKQTIEHAILSENTSYYIKPTPSYKTLEEELQHLTHSLRIFNSQDTSLLRFPHFLADHTTQETKNLQKKYAKQRQQFLPLLAEEGFLERILNTYTAP